MAETVTSVSAEEVEEILENKLGKKCTIVDYSLNMLGEWVGLCGDHALLEVKVKPEEQDSERNYTFFVKLYPRLEFVVDFIEWTGSFRKEAFVYKVLRLMREENITILGDCVSQCYLTVPNKLLILDNLIEQGYSSMNKHEVFDYDTVKVVLEALARFHASSLIYEEKKSCRLIDVFQTDLQESYYNDSEDYPYKDGIEAAILGVLNCIELFNFPEKLLSGKQFRDVLEAVLRKIHALVKPSKTFRNVICHGDIWATNLLIKRDDSGKPLKCKLVDFQCGRYTPPAQDVMSVLHLTTSRDFRKKHLYNLIGMYYTCLEKHVTLAGYDMKKIYTFDEFFKSCEEHKVFGLIQTATYFPLILLPSDVVQDFFGNKENNKEAIFVDRSLLIKEEMEKDEHYKKRIWESIQDLKDYCEYL